jgi:lipopolysaccharide/colanic/teichoic acid biosynthesis glycosyltransferase
VIFKHERMGYDWRRRQSKTFKMHKFRSMFHNCDQSPHEQHVRDWIRGQNVSERNSGLVKLTRDSRVTRVGRFLRKTSIDELPQLWDVLRGEMSMVGPRPVPLYEVGEYAPWHRGRLEATPGITCFWQVEGRGQVGVDEMVQMDLEYIERRSIWIDIKILLKTIPVVLSGRGAA